MEDLRTIKRVKRSPLRIFMGRMVYTQLRYLRWLLGHSQYCSNPIEAGVDFPHLVSSHCSPLFRRLKSSEDWMDQNKVHNLSLAIQSLNGLVLQPGKVFSYWKLIGAPFAYRGFKKGMVLVNGQVQAKTGGGLCQLSNLLYWMTLHSPLTVTERFRHSFDVFPDSQRTQPFGSGATCVYNYRDLQIRNDHVEALQLRLYMDGEYLYGEWRGMEPSPYRYEVYEAKHWISQQGSFYIRNNILRRRSFKDGKELEDQYLTENHALMMYSPLIDAPQSFADRKGNRRG